MTKKSSAGIIIVCAAGALALIGLIAYLINTGTAYYAKMGVDAAVVLCLAAAAVLTVIRILVGLKGNPQWADILPVCISVLTVVGFMMLVNARVNNIAAVMTFENSASNMADSISCFIALGAALIAMIMSFVAAFKDISE